MTTPLVSFCIPTFNRSRYLASLLQSLLQQLASFPYPFELVIADNASDDATQQVVAEFSEVLPIRALRHDTNIGGFPNVQFVMTRAEGRYVVYLADDDCVLGEPLARAIAAMEADPSVAVTYAPWLLHDLVDDRPLGQFYVVPKELRITRGDFAELLNHILKHHIFPEIFIARREVLQRQLPRISEHAFFAFVHAADYLAQGDMLIRPEPFYVSITRYFANEQRSQLGHQEVEVAWDRYRGGLEYLLARAGNAVGVEERVGFALRIQKMIAVRLSVAIRLRHAARRDPVDTHLLAMRLRGMGYESMLPVPMSVLASQAMLHFLLHDPLLNRDIKRMVCVGSFDKDTYRYLQEHAQVPVHAVNSVADAGALHDTLLFVDDEQPYAALDIALTSSRNLQLVRASDLCMRFGL